MIRVLIPMVLICLLPQISLGQTEKSPPLKTKEDYAREVRRLWGEARRLQIQKRFSSVPSLYGQVLGLLKKSPDLASHQRRLMMSQIHKERGDVYVRLGKYQKAVDDLERAKALAKGTFSGRRYHLYMGKIYFGLGTLYRKLGKSSSAVDNLKKSHRFLAKELPPLHPYLAFLKNLLGLLHSARGQYSQAHTYFKDALHQRLKIKAYSSPHPLRAQSYNNMGMCLTHMGKYRDALSYHRKALAEYARLAKKNPQKYSSFLEYAISHINFSSLLAKMGKTEEAQKHLRQALAQLKNNRSGRRELAGAWNSMGLLLLNMGKIEEAHSYLQKADTLMGKLYSGPHRERAAVWSNRGRLNMILGREKMALLFQKKAVSAFEKLLLAPHPLKLKAYLNLAGIHKNQGQIDQAFSLYQKAYREAKSLPSAPDLLAGAHHNMGLGYMFKGDWKKSRVHLEKALSIREKILPPGHGKIDVTRSVLAGLYLEQKEFARSHEMNGKAARSKIAALSQTFHLLNHRELAYRGWLDFIPLVSNQVNLAQAHPQPKILKQALALVIFQKNLVSDLAFRRNYLSSQVKNGKLKKLYRDYRETLRKLNRSLWQEKNITISKGSFARWRQQVAELERKISAHLKSFDRWKKLSLSKVEKIQQRLKPNQCLLEYAGYYHRQKKGSHLGVFVVKEKSLRFIPLGAYKKTEKAVHQILQRVKVPMEYGKIEGKRGKKRAVRWLKQEEAKLAEITSQLARRIWPEKLKKALAGIETVLVSPVEILHSLPLGMLALSSGSSIRYLAEEYKLQYLSSGKELLRPPTNQGKGFLGVEDPDYDRAFSNGKSPFTRREINSPLRGKAVGKWRRLARGSREVTQGRKFYHYRYKGDPQVVLKGKQATKKRFLKEAEGKRWIHLATHGYYLQPEKHGVPPSSAGEWTPSQKVHYAPPLLLSGLVLAGANSELGKNRAWGYLSAAEIAHLDLRGVECVLLSACETGLGKHYPTLLSGFKWSFGRAGAKYLICSLWKVPDGATASLVNRFYSRHLTRTVPQAFLKGQRDYLNQHQNNGRSHPYFWAGFIVQGVDRAEKQEE